MTTSSPRSNIAPNSGGQLRTQVSHPMHSDGSIRRGGFRHASLRDREATRSDRPEFALGGTSGAQDIRTPSARLAIPNRLRLCGSVRQGPRPETPTWLGRSPHQFLTRLRGRLPRRGLPGMDRCRMARCATRVSGAAYPGRSSRSSGARTVCIVMPPDASRAGHSGSARTSRPRGHVQPRKRPQSNTAADAGRGVTGRFGRVAGFHASIDHRNASHIRSAPE